ncbi:MAG: hypothetical protein EP305_02735 [Bacteroidetes bacterium]|nr:MAG: hypothetical protein EP305_02735 [Bacteroidota bacterium]
MKTLTNRCSTHSSNQFFCGVKYSVFFLFLVFSVSSKAQMLDNRLGYAFTDKPFFNVDFIRVNGIKEIHGQFTYKKPGEVMRATEYYYVYGFDENGRLSFSYETKKDDGTIDTVWNYYAYTANGILIEHKKTNSQGFNVVVYKYDEKDRVIRESHFREYRDSNDVQQRLLFNEETIEYKDYENQEQRIYSNSYGLPYKKEIWYYNELGYLTELEQQLLMTSRVIQTKYSYNDKGLLEKMDVVKDRAPYPEETTKFTYYENGDLESREYSKEEVPITRHEMIYDEKSKLLVYVLTKDVSTNFIMILGFKDYRFFSR